MMTHDNKPHATWNAIDGYWDEITIAMQICNVCVWWRGMCGVAMQRCTVHINHNFSVPTTARHTVVGMCDAHSPDFQIICSVHRTNVERYVRAWGADGYGFSFYSKLPAGAGSRHTTWYKIPVLYKTIRTPGVEFAFWMDSDSLFMTLAKPMPVPSDGKFLAISTHNLPTVHM